MKVKKNIIFHFLFLIIGFSPLSLKADDKCLKEESGYYLMVNGSSICVLDNASRDCFALVNRCPDQ